MKKIAAALNLAFAVILTIAFGTFLGIQLNHPVLGIITGFVLSLAYLVYSVMKK